MLQRPLQPQQKVQNATYVIVFSGVLFGTVDDPTRLQRYAQTLLSDRHTFMISLSYHITALSQILIISYHHALSHTYNII